MVLSFKGEPGMCEANAYLKEAGRETLIMEAVDKVEPDEDGIRLVSIFGDQKFIKGRIHSLSLVDHKVFISPE
jgi:predicted RNA-binding protein